MEGARRRRPKPRRDPASRDRRTGAVSTGRALAPRFESERLVQRPQDLGRVHDLHGRGGVAFALSFALRQRGGLLIVAFRLVVEGGLELRGREPKRRRAYIRVSQLALLIQITRDPATFERLRGF